jgi:hypothetical protein
MVLSSEVTKSLLSCPISDRPDVAHGLSEQFMESLTGVELVSARANGDNLQ